ncbi:MAG: T9SS type A sorting domain-containing protein [Bacteroidota bacterium]
MKYTLLTIILLLSHYAQAQSYEWNTLATGAGGWITGLDIHQTGHPIYARSDVGSAYRYNLNSQEWENIVTSTNLPVADVYWNQYGGVLSMVSAPSNPDRAYMAYIDAIYTSVNQGEDWDRTSFPSMDLSANDDDSKLSGERLAVDPINEEVVYFGTPENGLYRTEDGGVNWESVSMIPNGIPHRGVRQIVFDHQSGSTNGKTNTLYVTVDGEGVYQSVDAGITWSNISFNATGPIFLDSEIDKDGNLYCVGRDSNSQSFGIRRYDGLSWRIVQNNGTTYLNIAIDPFDTDRVVALSEGFTETALTTNAHTTSPTWSYPTRTLSAPHIPWMAWTESNWFTIGEMAFDPVVPNKLWISDGVGVWNVTNINTVNLIWNENSKGQEHLVSNDLVINQDGKVITAHWDRPLFLHDDLDTYPSRHQPSNRFNSSWDMDVSPSNRNFVVAIIEDHRFCCYDAEHRNSGFSTDGGLTWTKFPTQPDASNPDGIYGNIAIAASDSTNIVWLPTGNQAPYYTNNLGQTWQQASLPNNQGNCCLNFNFVYKKALSADKVLANTFYIYNWENGSIYVSSDGGALWEERTALQDFYGWNAKLSSVQGHASHLWFSHGAEQSMGLMQPLKRSTDGGLSWQTINHTSEVLNHAVGAPMPDADYPTIFIQGRVNGDFGYWMSTDEGVNWNNIGKYPKGVYDIASVMEADPDVPSRVYVGFRGNAFVYGQDQTVSSKESPENHTLDVVLYPNPSNGIIHIKSQQPITSLEIFSVTGTLLVNQERLTNGSSLNIDSLDKGIYFLKINHSTTYKIVKK